jgi:hypothetical protein
MIQFKRGKTDSWKKQKKPLAAGQPGYDKDKHKIKIGDGESSWSELPYASGLSNDEILSSEKEAKVRRAAASLLNPLAAILDSPAVITYGTDSPDENTIGQLYLQYYDAEPETDYIVASGIDRGWTYQKWKSGIAKCWITFKFTTTIQTAIGDNLLYQSSTTMPKIAYPFTFKEPPCEMATVQSPSSFVWLATSKGLNTAKQSTSYSIISPDKTTNSANYNITLEVTGFWK